MKRSAPSSHRTGQPRCVQLAEKAMKLSSLTRRSQTPLFAVTPAQGSDEGSVTVTATVAVHRPTSAIESFSKNRRRLISSGVSVSGADDDSVSFVSMANLRDPTGKRCEEEDNTDQPNDPDGDQSPEEKGDSHS